MNTLVYSATPTHKSTLTAYNQDIRYGILERLVKARAHPDRNPVDAMMDPPLMEAIIADQTWSKGTQKNYWVVLYNIAKSQDDAWDRRTAVMENYHKRFADINAEMAEESLDQVMSPAQKAAWMDYDSIQTFGKAFMERADVPLEDRIVAGLFTQLPPARLDYTDLEILTAAPALGPDTPNHVFIHPTDDSGGYVYIGKHKTSGSKGAIKHTLTPGLSALFREFATTLPKDVCLAITPDNLGKRLKRIFVKYSPEKKPVTVNIIRHAKATKDCETLPTLRNMIHDASQMKHSLQTHFAYAKKTA